MSITLSQVKKTIELYEKVKIGPGEKVVKTDKVGRKKNIEMTLTKKGRQFFIYFDGEKYARPVNKEKDAEKLVKDYLKLVGEEVANVFDILEVRGKAGSDDGDEDADKNIIMQLYKVISLRGMKPVEFDDGKKVKIKPQDAKRILDYYGRLRKPSDKLNLQKLITRSKKDFDKGLKAVMGEEVEIWEQAVEVAEDVQDIFVKQGDVNKIASQIARSAKGLGLKSALMGNQVRVKGPKGKVNDFLRAVIGKSSMGNATQVGKSTPQIDKMLNKQLKAQYDITEFKKMKVTIRDMDNRKKAISDLKKQRLNVAVSGGVIKVDGRGKDLNNIAKDLMNFYGANVVAEEVELDENASKAFDRIIKDGGIDKKDFQKAKQLYMKKDLRGLRKHIYNLDTSPLEAIMDVISKNDPKAFMKMYPKSKQGEYMSRIAYAHKEEVELDEKQEQGFLVKIPGIGELIIKAKNKAEIRKMLIKKFKKIDDFEINPKRMLEPQIKMWHRKKGGMAPEDEEDNNEE